MDTGISPDIALLCAAAAGVGVIHTLLGPDHYLPFVAMARVGRWSLTKTIVVTALCGVGHVLGSIVIGTIGILLGIGVFRLEQFEATRGSLAGWLMLAFGSVYLIWGLRRARTGKPHAHLHVHADGTVHKHLHSHRAEHAHPHGAPYSPNDNHDEAGKKTGAMTPWVLFTIFVFGPCEPLIPMLMYPASRASLWGIALVTLAFGTVTIATMIAVVVTAYLGIARFDLDPFAKYGHAAAGALVTACGAAVVLGM